VARLIDDDERLDPADLDTLEEEQEDLKTALDQAALKKSRYFAMVINGPEILALFAQKKPFRDGELRQERRNNRGTKIIQGTCQGEGGRKLVFNVEGKKPKLKKARLREFISQTTGLMLKPSFQAVQPAKP
jgi:hypothetical protein